MEGGVTLPFCLAVASCCSCSQHALLAGREKEEEKLGKLQYSIDYDFTDGKVRGEGYAVRF